ncbi:MAG: hypothetical protein AB1938_32600 [Myxococcota bacterium]
MPVGLFGPEGDAQVRALADAVTALGAEPRVLGDDDWAAGLPFSSLDGQLRHRGHTFDGLTSLYVRQVSTPFVAALEPARFASYEDWFVHSMQTRERSSFTLAWLLAEEARGVRMINPPTAMSALLYPTAQEAALRRQGALVARALVTNDPDAVKSFVEAVGEVESRALLGGEPWRAVTSRPIDLSSPRHFRECLPGQVHLFLAGDSAITSPETTLPKRVLGVARAVARERGLLVAGFTLARRRRRWVFLDVDAAPEWMRLDARAAERVTAAVARAMVESP